MLQFDVTLQRLCGIRYHLKCIILYFQSNPSVKTSVEHCKKSGIMFRILLNVVSNCWKLFLTECFHAVLHTHWIDNESQNYTCAIMTTLQDDYIYFQIYESFRKGLCSWDDASGKEILCQIYAACDVINGHEAISIFFLFCIWINYFCFIISFFFCIYCLKQNRKLSRWCTPPM